MVSSSNRKDEDESRRQRDGEGVIACRLVEASLGETIILCCFFDLVAVVGMKLCREDLTVIGDGDDAFLSCPFRRTSTLVAGRVIPLDLMPLVLLLLLVLAIDFVLASMDATSQFMIEERAVADALLLLS